MAPFALPEFERSARACPPEVAAALPPHIPALLDGGVRSGADTVLALGVRAVRVGRPALRDLATGGAAGATAVLELLRAALETAIALLGAPGRPTRTAARRLRPRTGARARQ